MQLACFSPTDAILNLKDLLRNTLFKQQGAFLGGLDTEWLIVWGYWGQTALCKTFPQISNPAAHLTSASTSGMHVQNTSLNATPSPLIWYLFFNILVYIYVGQVCRTQFCAGNKTKCLENREILQIKVSSANKFNNNVPFLFWAPEITSSPVILSKEENDLSVDDIFDLILFLWND